VRNKRRLKPAATFLTTFIEIPIQELSAFGATFGLKGCGCAARIGCVRRLRGKSGRNRNPFHVFPVKPGQPINVTPEFQVIEIPIQELSACGANS